MGNKNTIEFNGKVYNALTGKLIKPEAAAAGQVNKAQDVDGFIKPKPSSKHAPPINPKRPVGKQHHAHKPARSTTLIRSAVKKPAPKTRPTGKTQTIASTPAKGLSTSPIASRLNLGERRLVRAQQTAKDSSIKHFKRTNKDSSFGYLKPLPVKNPSASANLKPVAKIEKLTAVKKLDNILATSLAKATSHEQPAPANNKANMQIKLRARKVRWGIIIVLVLLLLTAGIFLLVRYIPSLKFDIANSRSGVHINLPSYEPAGFRFSGPGEYASGTLTLNFNDSGSNQSYSITAQNSDWDSQTLLYSFVIEADPKYQTQQKAELTLYIYKQTNVTWVNGGVWYRINGSSGLTANQLADIAISM